MALTAVRKSVAAIPQDNLIINGGFDFWQRGDSQTTSGYGSDDRWESWFYNTITGSNSKQEFTIGQTEVPGNPKYYSRTTIVAGTEVSDYGIKTHQVESVIATAGKTLTLSFYAKADSSKNIAIEARQIFGTDGSSTVHRIITETIALTSSWNKYEVTFDAPSISGKTVGEGSSLFIIFWLSAGTNWNAYNNSLPDQSITFDLAQVKLEYGEYATPFVPRPYTIEEMLCKRYYEHIYFSHIAMTASSTGNVFGWIPYVKKRAVPSVSYSDNGVYSPTYGWLTAESVVITPTNNYLIVEHLYAGVFVAEGSYLGVGNLYIDAEL